MPCPAVISAVLVGAFDGDTGVALVHVKKYGERPPVALAVTVKTLPHRLAGWLTDKFNMVYRESGTAYRGHEGPL